MKKTLRAIAAAIALFILILDGKTALQGAQEGIKLCCMAVIPSLFPLFVVTMLLCGKICRMPSGSESFFVPAFLSGYPAGAQALGQAYQNRQISKETAGRMLCFCNNAGPAFLFGMVAPQFPQRWMGFALWLIHMASAVLVAMVIPGERGDPISPPGSNSVSIHKALKKSIPVMATICGWIILFRVVLAFFDRWLFSQMPEIAGILLSGILELSNGCLRLQRIESLGLRFVLASGLLGFGGILAMNLDGLTLSIEVGDILVICASCFAAAGYLISKAMPKSCDALTATAWQQFIGGIILLAAGIASGGQLGSATLPGMVCLLFLILAAAVAYSLWFYLLQHNDVGRISVSKFLTPIFGVVFSGILLQEHIFTPENGIALVLVCSGVITVNRTKKR